jgi:DNA-binding MarR family transcriptional regulator/N-acetylglutamate synthase-like GNAT family acetyltransferase
MPDTVTALRAFNRFHTRFVGALDAGYMGSDMSLAEARLLYEIVNRDGPLAAELGGALGLDAGYASRLLKGLEAREWIARGRGKDARQRPIALTPAGQAAFDALDDVTRTHIEASIAHLTEHDRAALVGALETVSALLGEGRALPWHLRTFKPGDMGMIAARQSILYHEHWGWGTQLEALEGEITANFLRDFKPGREQCWVAERGGRMIGAIFCVDSGDNAAQLRLLHVEPEARGLGIGEALVRTCVEFAKDAGYARIWLWTHAVLLSARRIYAATGFQIIATEMHDEFGKAELGETWELVFTR